MNYDKIIELNNVTLQDCCELFQYKDIRTVINDGRIVNFVSKEDEECQDLR